MIFEKQKKKKTKNWTQNVCSDFVYKFEKFFIKNNLKEILS